MNDESHDRDPLEALASDFIERHRRGESPDVEEFAREHSDLADEIRDLFPAMLEMERLKTDIEGSDGIGPAVGRRLGDFLLVREVGRGGMGVVYEAEQESLARRVALKVLPGRLLPDPKHLMRFRREAQVAAGLHHTNIVQVYGVGQAEGYHFYVMQYIRGAGLDDVLARLRALRESGEDIAARIRSDNRLGRICLQLLAGEAGTGAATAPLTPRSGYWHSVARLAWQAADALAYAHRQGVLHRDVKPANFLLDEQGDLWVADFGLAKAARSEDLTRPTDITGTLPYVPPERFCGEYDERSDVYGLGLTLYELLTLRRAFDDGDRTRLMRRIVETDPAPVRKIAPAAPRDLETIALKACAREPGHRYATAEAMAADLQRFLENRPIEARRISPLERLGRWARRNPVVAGLTAAVLVLTVLVAAVATVGYVRATAALRREEAQRSRAEAISDVALEALDRVFERFAPRAGAPRELSVGEGEEDTAEVTPPAVLSREAAALLQDMLPYYDRLAKVVGDEEGIRERTAWAQRRVGDIQSLLGDHAAAVGAYQRSAEIYDGLFAETGSSEFGLQVAGVYNDLGRLQSSTRHLAEAAQAHENAMEILTTDLGGKAGGPDVRFELARTQYSLAITPRPGPEGGPLGPPAGGPGPPEGRRRGPMGTQGPRGMGRRMGGDFPRGPGMMGRGTYLREATDLLEGLRAEDPHDRRYRHLLALCYRERGPGRMWMRRGGEDTQQRAIELLGGLVAEFPQEPEYRYDLAEALARAGGPGRGRAPDPAEAERRLRRALELSQGLVSEHPFIPRYASSQAHILHRLAMLLREGGRIEEAEGHLRRAIAVQEALAEQFADSAYYRIWLAVFRGSLAETLLATGRQAEGRGLLEAANAMLESLLAEQPELWFLRMMIRRNLELLEHPERALPHLRPPLPSPGSATPPPRPEAPPGGRITG